MYQGYYAAVPKFEVIPLQVTGSTPEFVVSEMTCKGVAGFDLPAMGLKAGDTLELIGASLFWWKWEGEGEQWDGSLADEAIRGWKITHERVYFQPRKANSDA
jgi:hypothetical protein